MHSRLISIMGLVVHLAALLPLLLLIWDFSRGDLGANPIREVQLRTGSAAINLLMASLACTPIQILTGFSPVLSLKGPLGIYAFLYALLHFFNFVGVDYAFNLTFLKADLFEKYYAVVGFASFLLLLPLGIASLPRLKQRLGKTWFKLKWLVYPAACLAVAHYFLQARVDVRLPILYSAILAFLLLIRLPLLRQAQSRWRGHSRRV
jgi:methionine sulfoxide reductase heme-binding subunit